MDAVTDKLNRADWLAGVCDAGALVRAGLTPRQADVYAYLIEHTMAHGFPPTIREIGLRFDIGSPNGVMCHLLALERKGKIRRDANQSRSISFPDFRWMPVPNEAAAAAGEAVAVPA